MLQIHNIYEENSAKYCQSHITMLWCYGVPDTSRAGASRAAIGTWVHNSLQEIMGPVVCGHVKTCPFFIIPNGLPKGEGEGEL